MRVTALTIAILCLCPVLARAQEPQLPKELACTFASGTVWSFDKTSATAKPSSPFAFAIADIDLDVGIAMLKSKEGESALKIVRAIGAHHFIEVSVEGFLNLTTVYEPRAGETAFPAAHSRHLGLLGEPIISQYAGSCSAGP